MRLSIRTRVIVALNAFVLCLALTYGWIAREVAGQIVEARFAREMVSSVSHFLVRNDFPRSQLMMRYLKEMFNADWVVSNDDASHIVASSLPAALKEEFAREVARVNRAGVILLGGTKYRMDSEDVLVPDFRSDRFGQNRLFILVPYTIFQEARAGALSRVTRISWLAAGIATLVAILLAVSITRPIGQLADEMVRLAQGETLESMTGDNRPAEGPLEISRLALSFRRLMDRLSEARSELARSERLATLGKVCLSVAHELRNPLSGIKMNVRVLKDELEPSRDNLSGVESILREIDRMELYLNELMSLSPDARPAPRALDYSEARLSDLSESVLEILSGKRHHAKITLKRDYPQQEPPLLVDSNQIRQAMMNLIVNAIEVMAGGGTLCVAVHCLPSAMAYSVSDTGKGVQCAGADIFDAFVSGKPNGVGLGLYLCKQIVERHGGSIGYESSDQGSVFRFELPRTIPPDAGGATGFNDHGGHR